VSSEALEMARRPTGKLDVLLTDIVMPVMRGPELARRVSTAHPEVQVMYMSGYAEGFEDAQLPPTPSSCKNHFVLQPFSNSLNSSGANLDVRATCGI
jgi:CheY-like chemotaxis protein